MGRGRSRAALQVEQQPRLTLQRLLDPRWPFRAVPSWEEGVKFPTPSVNQSLNVGRPRRGCDLG